MKTWTTKEIQHLKKNSLFAETNEVLNISEMAKKLKRSPAAVSKKIYDLRRNGDLPKIDRANAFDSKGRPWNVSEDKTLIAMKKNGATHSEIAEALDRSVTSINARSNRLIKKSKIRPVSTRWRFEDEKNLLENVTFDENGFVNNYPELARITGKRYEQVQAKVQRMRKAGTINKSPEVNTTSIKSKEAMNRFNQARFAHISKKQEAISMTESTENLSDISIESKQVCLILTTVIVNGQQTDQYFTQTGELIATKKPTSSANEVSK